MTGGASLRVARCAASGFMASATAGINIGSASEVFISDTVVSQKNLGIVLDGGANAELAPPYDYNHRRSVLMASID
jgi:hypothetical protein